MGHQPTRTIERPRRKLTPAMASFRLLVLDFVRAYFRENGASPSYGEIAGGLESSRNQVKVAVKSLVRDRLLLQGERPRSLALPSERDAAIRALEGLGFRVDEDARTITQPITDPPLLPPATLDYVPDVDSDQERGERGQGERTGGEESGRAG